MTAAQHQWPAPAVAAPQTTVHVSSAASQVRAPPHTLVPKPICQLAPSAAQLRQRPRPARGALLSPRVRASAPNGQVEHRLGQQHLTTGFGLATGGEGVCCIMLAACAAARPRLARGRRRRYGRCGRWREGAPLGRSALQRSPLPGTECFAVTSGNAKVSGRTSQRATAGSAAACSLRPHANAGPSSS